MTDTGQGMPEWIEALRLSQGLPESYSGAALEHLPALARRIAALHRRLGRPVVVGINGAQGSGKTTFARFLREWLERETGLNCVRLSLDDVYLGRKVRQALARDVHPLLATRGVPGTHDVALAHELLDALTGDVPSDSVRLPRFDKARDDRLPASAWPSVATPVEAVLFEGWCVGARPQDPGRLEPPVNELEAGEDRDGRWRRYVNGRLHTDYGALFDRLDALVMLRVPDFDKVFEWRRQQEQRLREDLAGDERAPQTQSDGQLKRFVMHYERLTRHMLETLPGRADSVIDLDDNHRMASRRDREDWGREAPVRSRG